MEGMFVLADFSHLGMIGILSNLGNMDRNSGSNLEMGTEHVMDVQITCYGCP